MGSLDLSRLGDEAFPLTVRAFRVSDDAEVWTETVKRPGMLEVPALGPCWIRYEYADGEVVEIGRSRLVRALVTPLRWLRRS